MSEFLASEQIGGPIFSLIAFGVRLVIVLFILSVIWSLVPSKFKAFAKSLFSKVTKKGDPANKEADGQDATRPFSSKLADVLNQSIERYQKACPFATATEVIEYIREEIPVGEAAVLQQQKLAKTAKVEPTAAVGGDA